MRYMWGRQRCLQSLFAAVCLTSASAMSTTPDGDFDVQSPSVLTIRKSLVDRHAVLKEHFEAGAIGISYDGLIALREPARLPPVIRARLESLVVEDNKDRGTLFREIARANGRPDWESQFQAVFAARWIRRAPVGWYYRDDSGNWIRQLVRNANDEAPAKPFSVVPLGN